jgi:hypothetical protein
MTSMEGLGLRVLNTCFILGQTSAIMATIAVQYTGNLRTVNNAGFDDDEMVQNVTRFFTKQPYCFHVSLSV